MDDSAMALEAVQVLLREAAIEEARGVLRASTALDASKCVLGSGSRVGDDGGDRSKTTRSIAAPTTDDNLRVAMCADHRAETGAETGTEIDAWTDAEPETDAEADAKPLHEKPPSLLVTYYDLQGQT